MYVYDMKDITRQRPDELDTPSALVTAPRGADYYFPKPTMTLYHRRIGL